MKPQEIGSLGQLYGAWTKLTADQRRGKNLSYGNNNTAITKTKKEKML